MRYALISDIHGNLEAFEAVLDECRRLKVDRIFCGGDIVGYGANPGECLMLVRRLNIASVAGNHDWAVSGKLDFSYFTPDAKAAVEWTRQRMGIDEISFLNMLPLSLKNENFTLVHGTLQSPEQFIYMTNASKASDTFALMEGPLCFVGHTHVPVVFIKQEDIYPSDILDIEINPNGQYIINLGSVGQPRDHNPLASFCVYDSTLGIVENHRVLYDIKKAQQKILDAHLPAFLAYRLAEGR